MPTDADTDAHKKGYETTDVPFRPWAWFSFGFIVLMVIIYLAVSLFTRFLAGTDTVIGRTVHNADKSLGQFPQPRLQADPPADLQAYFKEKEQDLTTYGWVDRKAGIVRIPVDRAIDSFIRQGPPVRPADSGLTELDMQIQKAGGAKILPPTSSHRPTP